MHFSCCGGLTLTSSQAEGTGSAKAITHHLPQELSLRHFKPSQHFLSGPKNQTEIINQQ